MVSTTSDSKFISTAATDGLVSARCRAVPSLLLAVAWLAPAASTAEQLEQLERPWHLCPVDGFPEEIESVDLPEGTKAGEMPAEIEADYAEADLTSVRLRGAARLQQADRRLFAEDIFFDRSVNEVEATGGLRYDQPDFTLFGERGFADIDAERVEIGEAEFYYHAGHYRGSADNVEVFGTGVADLERVTATTCPRGSKAWEIRAREVNLDRNTGRGEARNATLRLGGVPVLYSPYISFPIDDRRKSGFLYPRIGNSDVTGFDVTVPYYWNIAPERDFTFLPRYMSKRGLMLGGEYRFLGRRYEGSLYGTFLDNDDNEGGRNRWAVSYFTDIRPAPRWDAQVAYNRVSDVRYLEDFGDSLRTASQAQLDQSVRTRYRADDWRATFRFQKYQNVDPEITTRREPHERKPEFTFLGRWPDQFLGLTFRLRGSYNQFEHPTQTDGGRLHLYPTLSLPLLRSFGYINPRLSLSYRNYRLRDNDDGGDRINRAIPVASLDTGVFFDRPQPWGEKTATHTLEPRLFYLFVPKKNQDNIPLFDTSDFSTNYQLLFRENRFTGPDRIGDANQLTLALTTRVLVEGEEQIGFDIGQIRYFRDRRVTTDGSSETRNSSDIIAQGRLNLKNGLRFRGSIQWDPHDSETNVARADLRYNPESGKQVNFFYRFERGSIRQIDVSGFWPVTPSWKVMARSLYSLDGDTLLDAVLGLEYEDCCWAFRLAGRQFRSGTDDDNLKSAVFLELELKGLAGIGNDLTGVLEDAITGYKTNR